MTEWTPKRCLIVGSSGGIGSAFVEQLLGWAEVDAVYGLSRSEAARVDDARFKSFRFDYDQLSTLDPIVQTLTDGGPLDLVIVATGLLHDSDIAPEKSLRDLDAERLARAYEINAIGPMMVAKAFLPLLRKDQKSVFAVLSARVGSISDNRIGGWYGYRAAKSGLNQLLRTASIEHARRWPQSVVIGLHPGTVDTQLSKPFQRNVGEAKLFTPSHSARAMLSVIQQIAPSDTGKIFAYDGTEVPA